MKITIVYQYFQDHSGAGHSSKFELAKYLVECGHEVSVVSGESGYMEDFRPARAWYQRLLSHEIVSGIEIFRTISHTERNRSYFGRLVGFITFALTCPFALMRGRRPDVIFASSPPLFAAASALLVSFLRRAPLVLEVCDLWPDSASELGIVRNSILIAAARAVERTLYKYSHNIVALTDGIRTHIIKEIRQQDADKVVLVTTGIDAGMLYPNRSVGEATRSRLGWKGKHVVLYLGAMGEPHNLDVVLRAAARLRERADIIFVLIGDGYMRSRLELTSKQLELTNTIFLRPIPKQEANSYLNAADFGLVTLLDIPLFSGAIPTKMLDYMACGKPVLCGVRGEAKQIVEQAGAGIVFEPEDDEELARQITALSDDQKQRREMGERGTAYVRMNFAAIDKQKVLEKLLLSAAERPREMSSGDGTRD